MKIDEQKIIVGRALKDAIESEGGKIIISMLDGEIDNARELTLSFRNGPVTGFQGIEAYQRKYRVLLDFKESIIDAIHDGAEELERKQGFSRQSVIADPQEANSQP